jgi:hypothetical protein
MQLSPAGIISPVSLCVHILQSLLFKYDCKCHYANRCYAECCCAVTLYVVMLSVSTLNVIMLSVVMLNVMAPKYDWHTF